jgi:predicted MFS family arabinose efflux permease
MNTDITPQERRAVWALGGIMALRMIGLFMILPVFSLYATQLQNVTPTLIGVAIGIYGLTQAAFQIPFGMLSDRFGRKPIIAIGLILFAIGCVVAAISTTIEGVLIGRALQGAGAISAALMALVADLTAEEHRAKAMGILGMGIGMAFMVGMAAGPVLSHLIGVPGMFWLIAVLAFLAIGVLYLLVPNPKESHLHRDAEAVPSQFKRVLKDFNLMRLNAGTLFLHSQLTAMFVVIPLALQQNAGLPSDQHGWIYLPMMVFAMLAAVPFIVISEKKHRLKFFFISAIGILAFVQIGLVFLHQSLIGLIILLWLFFSAFTFLEANLPSLISRTAPADSKGTALGVFATWQFLGAFVGGVMGGWLHKFGIMEVFVFCGILNLLWLGVAFSIQAPRYLSNHLLHLNCKDEQHAQTLTQQLLAISGVAEAIVVYEEQVAYLKIDKTLLDENALEQVLI